MSHKLSVPAFLKVLTNGSLPVQKAMSVAAKIYKTSNTPAALASLTDLQLKRLGIDDKDDRRHVLAAIKKTGYKPGTSAEREDPVQTSGGDASHGASLASTSNSPRKRRRGADNDVNELLPAGAPDEATGFGSLEFNEVLDEDVLRTKSTVVNRAPIMTAWATVVAERLGFKREEALSIASAYTEMNAISKGVALGIFDKGKGTGVELASGETQPYVDFMGRRPVFTTQSGEWRALVKGQPVLPSNAYAYVLRALRQTLPFVIGALRLLAESFAPAELNNQGFTLYAEFRPEVNGWGGRGEVRCETILALRRERPAEVIKGDPGDEAGKPGTHPDLGVVGKAGARSDGANAGGEVAESPRKKLKLVTLDEYGAALGDNEHFDFELEGF